MRWEYEHSTVSLELCIDTSIRAVLSLSLAVISVRAVLSSRILLRANNLSHNWNLNQISDQKDFLELLSSACMNELLAPISSLASLGTCVALQMSCAGMRCSQAVQFIVPLELHNSRALRYSIFQVHSKRNEQSQTSYLNKFKFALNSFPRHTSLLASDST